MEWYEVLILVLGVATLAYWVRELYTTRKYDGQIRVFDKPNGTRVFSLELEGDPMDLEPGQRVIFLVKDDEPKIAE